MGINVLDDDEAVVNEQTAVRKKASIYLENSLIKEVIFEGDILSDGTKGYLSLRFQAKNKTLGDDDVIVYGENISVIVESVK